MASEAIATILLEDLIRSSSGSSHHQKLLLKHVEEIVGKKERLQLFVPTFPMSVGNKKEKLGGFYPDYVELLAIKTLLQCARRLEEIYYGGVEFMIMLDYQSFEKADSEIASNYQYEVSENALKKVIYQLGGEDVIKCLSVTNFHLECEATSLCMVNQALVSFRRQHKEPNDHIQLAINGHLLPNLQIDLFKAYGHDLKGQSIKSWQKTMLFDAGTGQYHLVHCENMLGSKGPDTSILKVVHHEGKPMLMIKLHLTEEDQFTDEIEITLIKPNTGLMIKTTNKKQTTSVFTSATIKNLITEFGVIVFRGFSPFANEEEFIKSFKRLTPKSGIVKWDYGHIHKIQPSSGGDYSVEEHTNGGLPMHWDTSIMPGYMGIDQNEYSYPDYVSPFFALYCKRITKVSQNHEGATTMLDSKALVLSLNGKLIQRYKQIILEYYLGTKVEPHDELKIDDPKYNYPLVMKCPGEAYDVLRWLQQWNEKESSNTMMFAQYDISQDTPPEWRPESEEILEEEIKKLAFDDRFYFPHTYEAGDQVLINNYTILHGRNPFTSNNRELWRLQALPETTNQPDYFKKNN